MSAKTEWAREVKEAKWSARCGAILAVDRIVKAAVKASMNHRRLNRQIGQRAGVCRCSQCRAVEAFEREGK